MKFCKLDSNNVVVFVQPYGEAGLVECADSVECGSVFDGVSYNAPIIDITWYKKIKNEEILRTYQSAIQALVGVVDSAEMTSWAKQEAEARAVLADPLAVTPILSVLVVARGFGETVPQLATIIVTKADAYAVQYASILGIYQAKQKQLELATTVAEVLAVI